MKAFKAIFSTLVVLALSTIFLVPAAAQVDPTGEGEEVPSSSATSSATSNNGGSVGADPNQQFITGIAVGAGVGVVAGGILGWVLKRDPR